MKGRGVLIFSLVLVLSMSFLSAGLFDFLKKKESITITGDVISEEYLDFRTCSDCIDNGGKWCVDPDSYSPSVCIPKTDNCEWYYETFNSCSTGEEVEEIDSMDRKEFIFLTGKAVQELDSLENVDTCIVDSDCISQRDKCVEGICEPQNFFDRFFEWVSIIFDKS